MSKVKAEPSKQSQGKVTHINRPTHIPDTPAGQRCRDVLYSIAKKMCDAANEATGKYIESNYPAAKTIGKEFVDRKYKRTIKCGRACIVIVFDYKTKSVSVEQKGGDL